MIKTERLSKRFGSVNAVENLTIEVASGEIFGFLGPNGAGKTTTIRLLSGLIAPSGGKAWVNGFELGKQNDKVRASIGLLTETPGLYEQLSALDNMLFYAELYTLSKSEARQRVQEALEWLSLWNRRNDQVITFSKGMKQKLAIGRALLHRPQILFLDEPTAGLDAESARTVRDAIVTLKNTKRTIFLSTHNMDEADKLCERIGIFKNRLIQVDSPRNLRRRFGVNSRRVRVQLRSEVTELQSEISKLPFVQQVELESNNINPENVYNIYISLDDPDNQNPQLVKRLVELGAEIQYVEEQTATLEDVYLNLTH
ncbi:ABC transporter ATP-binding protein [Candidatus Chlorohelix sp.]|uniref:ABC transporter ATP-binding protein n=1 Tax=Candidatus Chlorohelix sp. TaxID=3139201 RepID=UPI0030202E6D